MTSLAINTASLEINQVVEGGNNNPNWREEMDISPRITAPYCLFVACCKFYKHNILLFSIEI
jgi:hypothetical protein